MSALGKRRSVTLRGLARCLGATEVSISSLHCKSYISASLYHHQPHNLRHVANSPMVALEAYDRSEVSTCSSPRRDGRRARAPLVSRKHTTERRRPWKGTSTSRGRCCCGTHSFLQEPRGQASVKATNRFVFVSGGKLAGWEQTGQVKKAIVSRPTMSRNVDQQPHTHRASL